MRAEQMLLYSRGAGAGSARGVLPVVQAVGMEGNKEARRCRGIGGGRRKTAVKAGEAVGCRSLRREARGQHEGEEAEPVVGEIAYYRRYTEGMLRRYLRLSMEAGKVPSLIGRPMFRGGRVTRYKVQGFDDVVIFVHDVEGCLRQLTTRQQALIERIAVQEHAQEDVAEMLGMSLRSVNRHYGEALDALSRVFLQAGLMEAQAMCQASCA